LRLLKNISDSELVQKINLGEKQAYQELFERYAPRIYQFFLSYLKNKTDAEELVQDVFLKIWEKRLDLDQRKNFKSFIFKIAVNKIYDFIRKKNIENAFNDFAQSNFISGENYTWHEVIFEEMKQNLQKLLSELPKQQQKIFYLSKEKGLTNEEIASQLGLSKRTVENHLYRALFFIKGQFKNESLIALFFFYLIYG